MVYTVKIEQTYHYPNRMKYIAETDSFVKKDSKSLSYARNVRQPYGWIKESGTPPCRHLDVIVMTEKEYELGDEDRINIIGVFKRNDGDHKLVGVLEDRNISDLSELTETEKEDMHRLYPREDAVVFIRYAQIHNFINKLPFLVQGFINGGIVTI